MWVVGFVETFEGKEGDCVWGLRNSPPEGEPYPDE